MRARISRGLPVAVWTVFWVTLPLAAQLNTSEDFKMFRAREVGPAATGGRVVDMAVDPNDPFHILVASASGGLFETRNNGTTWECIFQNENTLSIGDIAFDPKDTNVIWVGTGEANNQRSSLWGDGIYKSTDGGKSWTNMGLKDSQHIGRIVVDPSNSDVVYVAALVRLYGFNEERGLYKTSDGGKTWDKVLYVDEKTGVVDVVIDPSNPNTIYAATYQRLRRAWNFDGAGPGSGIYKSSDAGKTWQRMSNGLPSGNIGRIGLAIYPKNPKVLYASVSNQNLANPQAGRTSTFPLGTVSKTTPSTSPGNWNPNFYHESENAGAAAEFVQEDNASKQEPAESKDEEIETPFGFKLEKKDGAWLVSGISRRSAAYRSGVRNEMKVLSLGGIQVDQSDSLSNFLQAMKTGDKALLLCLVEGSEKSFPLTSAPAVPRRRPARQIGGEVYKTTDGGDTWKKVNRRAAGGSPAYYYGQIRVDPNDENRLYMMSVPVYVSEDGGKNWRTDGARSVHVDHHAFWINPENSNHLMLGNDGGFHVSYDRGKTWDHVFNLNMAQFYAIGADMQYPYHVYGVCRTMDLGEVPRVRPMEGASANLIGIVWAEEMASTSNRIRRITTSSMANRNSETFIVWIKRREQLAASFHPQVIQKMVETVTTGTHPF